MPVQLSVTQPVGRVSLRLVHLVGGAVLIILASLGAAIVRTSLRPLVAIEQTAAAIAAGDLSRRVPDPEQHTMPAKTELGRLSRALNAMLGQALIYVVDFGDRRHAPLNPIG